MLQQLAPFEMPPSLFSSNWIGGVAHPDSRRAYKLKAGLNITLLVINSFQSNDGEGGSLGVSSVCPFFPKREPDMAFH